MNDLIKNRIAEDKYFSAKEILKLSDTSRFWYNFVPVFLIDINQTKNRLLRRASFKVMVENE